MLRAFLGVVSAARKKMWAHDRGAHLYVMAYGHSLETLKIGRSDNPERRAYALAAGHPFRVNVVCVFPNLGHLEADLHRRFQDARVEGGSGREWFQVTLPAIVAQVESHLKGNGDAALVEEARDAEKKLRRRSLDSELRLVEAKAAAVREKERARLETFAARARIAFELQQRARAAREEAKSQEREAKLEATRRAKEEAAAELEAKRRDGAAPSSEAAENGIQELHQEWTTKLAAFLAARVRPTEKAVSAATAAEVRQAFAQAVPNLNKKGLRLRLAGAGFAENLTKYRDGLKSTSKRTYSYAFDEGKRFVRLEPVPVASGSVRG